MGGNSMLPTLHPGDTVLVDTAYYSNKTFERSDLVAIQFSTRKGPMIKRIIAIPGDSVTIDNGRIHLNGKPLDEPYLSEQRILSLKSSKLLSQQLSRYNNHVPQNNLIVMGDNIEKSFDSGDCGFISESQVVGKANIKEQK